MKDNYRRKRIILLIMMIILIPAGLLMKRYSGAGHLLFNNKLAGILYVVFWSFFAAFIFVRRNPLLLVVIVFLITCGLEFLQLYSNPLLDQIRSTFLGRTLIGNTFSWSDMLYYLIGSILSWYWLKKIDKAYLLS